MYGSIAQNRDHANSDIDLMTVKDGQILAALRPAESELARPVQVAHYTVGKFLDRKQLKHHFNTEVVLQPRLMIVGTRGVVALIVGGASFL